MSKMSFQQKRKHRSILPSSGSIDDEIIFESQKTKSNKSLLDFKSPKLSRLKNFIISPVQKSYNKYKQFQDNDEENSFIEDKIDLSPTKRLSADSINVDSNSSMSAINQESKAKSQTSILTTISSIPTDSSPTSPISDHNRNQSSTLPGRQTPVKAICRSLTHQSKSAKSSSNSANISVTGGHSSDKDTSTKIQDSFVTPLSPYRPLVKSASSSGLMKSLAFEESSCVEDSTVVEKVDGSENNAVVSSGDTKNNSIKWNATVVDIEMTDVMLKALDDHIKIKRDKITKDVSQKEEMVDKLISNFTLNSDNKSSKKIRREYESMNKSAEKSLEKTQMELEQLEYKRLIVSQEGIPWGVNPSDHVKNISKKDRNKKMTDVSLKEIPGPVARILKGNIQKSASAENVSQVANNKLNDDSIIKPWVQKPGSVKKSKDTSQKYMTLDTPLKSLSSNVTNTASKSPSQSQTTKKPSSAGNGSAISGDIHFNDKNFQTKKSQSNSVSSYTGREHIHETIDNRESPRNLSFTSAEDTQKSDEVSSSRFQTLQDEMSNLKKEIHDVRSDCHRFQCDNDNLKLDMNTNSEINSHKMQNAIERVDRLERILDILKQQCQIEFCSWKDEFKSLEEKLDYRLTTTRRDLQDNIDSCNNSISLVEKRTEQLPFLSSRSGKSDVKIITDHLCNLVVSLIAFIMLLLSSGFHLLIRFLNIGATISQHRNTLLLPLLLTIIAAVVTVKWSLLSKLHTFISDSDYNTL